MIEVPGAALLAEELLEPLDFVSIGTNDLAQYTMGADRLSADLTDLTDRWQPAILRLIRTTGRAAAKAGKQMGVCGESAADPLMALVLAGLGASSLSMSSPALPAVRYALATHTLRECQTIAEEALKSQSAEQAREAARRHAHPELLDVLRL